MVPKAKLSAEDQPDEVDPAINRRYRSIVGALCWLSNGTRPDIRLRVDGGQCRRVASSGGDGQDSKSDG